MLSGATELDIRFYIASYTSSAQFVLGQGDGTSGSSLSFTVSMSGNYISLRASDGTSAILAASSLPFDSWIDSTGNITNSTQFRIGRFSGAGGNYGDFELFAVYIYRKALTAAEIAAGVQYWNAA